MIVNIYSMYKCSNDNMLKRHIQKTYVNKKVLLRERRRHTARRVASSRSVAMSPDWGGGVYSHPVPMGGTSIQF